MSITVGYLKRATNTLNVKKPLHFDYVIVWCGMTYDFLVGPYLFETQTSSGPKRCSVTGPSYGAILREQVIPALQERHCLETTVFMQKGVPPHIAKPVKKLLHDIFGAD